METPSKNKKNKWFLPLAASLLLSTFLIFSSLFPTPSSSRIPTSHPTEPVFVESKLCISPLSSNPISRLAYLISGSVGDGQNLKRALRALYHPFNHYVLHLDLEAPSSEREDLLHTLSSIPRYLNFIEHTSDIGWKEFQRARPVIVDPGLYSSKKSDFFWVTEKRSLPTAFKLFTGSAWMMLTRSFIEYCLWGWDNLPRTVLMYYANFLSSPEGYFHTVICNSDEFRNTTVNHDLHFISWDNPPKQHPHFLTVGDFQKMIDSRAPFARKFNRNERVLDMIDQELLGLSKEGFVPGGWFNGSSDPHYLVGNGATLMPGPGAERLSGFITSLITRNDFHEKHCL